MDILTASNFERMISHLFGPGRTAELYSQFGESGAYQLTSEELEKLNSVNMSASCVDGLKAGKISDEIQKSQNYQLCPHSAVGVAAQIDNRSKLGCPRLLKSVFEILN